MTPSAKHINSNQLQAQYIQRLEGGPTAIRRYLYALPDDQGMVILQRARVFARTGLSEVKGLFLQIPNDLFNGNRRTYASEAGVFELEGCSGTLEVRPISGDWLAIWLEVRSLIFDLLATWRNLWLESEQIQLPFSWD